MVYAGMVSCHEDSRGVLHLLEPHRNGKVRIPVCGATFTVRDKTIRRMLFASVPKLSCVECERRRLRLLAFWENTEVNRENRK